MEASIDAMIARVEGLKEKVGENLTLHVPRLPRVQLNRLHEKSGRPNLSALQKRIDHVQELEAFTTTDSVEYNQWTDTRLD